jgi:hypothetical protein
LWEVGSGNGIGKIHSEFNEVPILSGGRYMSASSFAQYSINQALAASAHSQLAYQYAGNASDFKQTLGSLGWTLIDLKAAPGLPNQPTGTHENAFSYSASRNLSSDRVQFVYAIRGSDSPTEDWRDWIWNNASQYGWSHYYEQVREPFAEMLAQALSAQASGKSVEILVTGHSLGGAAAQAAFADLILPAGQGVWVDAGAPLGASSRLFSEAALSSFTSAQVRSLVSSATAYTFGAPSLLIDPQKPTIEELIALGFETSINLLQGNWPDVLLDLLTHNRGIDDC